MIDTASKAYSVYLAATSYYYSYLSTVNSSSISSTSAQYKNFSSALDEIDDALAGINYSNKTVISAEARNKALNLEKKPYKPGTPVFGFKTTQPTQYVRVYTEGVTTPQGGWMMKYSDIHGLTPTQIKDKFALPSEKPPTHYCYVNVPSGTQIYAGIANTIPEWGMGGGIQFELGQYIPTSSFGVGIPLS